MDERFLRNEMMLGPEAVEKLASAHVCVFGLGGVGSYVVEGLARSGVGELTLVDQDAYGESNINRQLGALTSTLGQGKAEVLARRVLDINPRCAVHPIRGVYCREDRERFLAQARRMADDFLQGKPDAAPDEVAGCLGEPEELAQCFLEELDPELLERRKRRRKLGRRIFAGVVAAAMILLLVWVVLLETQPMKVEVTERLIIYEEREGPDET